MNRDEAQKVAEEFAESVRQQAIEKGMSTFVIGVTAPCDNDDDLALAVNCKGSRADMEEIVYELAKALTGKSASGSSQKRTKTAD